MTSTVSTSSSILPRFCSCILVVYRCVSCTSTDQLARSISHVKRSQILPEIFPENFPGHFPFF